MEPDKDGLRSSDKGSLKGLDEGDFGEPDERSSEGAEETNPRGPDETTKGPDEKDLKGGTWLLEFLPENNHFRALTKAGKISQTLGREVAGQTLLTVPEAVYLFENDRAKLVGEETLQDVLQRLLAQNIQNPDLWKVPVRADPI